MIFKTWVITGGIWGKVRNVYAEIELPIDFDKGLIEKVTKFDVDHRRMFVNNVDFDVDNLWKGFEWMISGVTTMAVRIFKPYIVPALEDKAKNEINNELAGKYIKDLIP